MKAKIKHLAMVCVILAITSNANAQIFGGGIVGGISTSAVKIEDIGTKFTNLIKGNDVYGFEVGAFAKLQLRPFYIKAMGLYNFNSGNVTYQTDDNGVVVNHTNDFSFQKFEIPLLGGFEIGPFGIEAGPVYNYVIQSTSNFDANNVNIQRNGMGYRVGAVLTLGNFLMHISYEGAAYYSSNITNATFKEPYKLTFGIGIKLGNDKNNK
jgi:hypothetical protein